MPHITHSGRHPPQTHKKVPARSLRAGTVRLVRSSARRNVRHVQRAGIHRGCNRRDHHAGLPRGHIPRRGCDRDHRERNGHRARTRRNVRYAIYEGVHHGRSRRGHHVGPIRDRILRRARDHVPRAQCVPGT